MGTNRQAAARIQSLDQFRGYTVLGMFFVNFVGGFDAIPAIFKHHNTYCSYADTIMPQFFFAVGFAYRLTLLRRLEAGDKAAAYARVFRRNLGLILLGIVLYHLDGRVSSWQELQALGVGGFLSTAFQREPFQTLVHIGITSLWVLPVIAAGTRARLAFGIASAGLHLALSHAYYFDWVWNRPGIDGGYLGFMTWTIPVLAGSFAYDWLAQRGPAGALRPLVGWGVALMFIGYLLSCVTLFTAPNSANLGAPAGWWMEPPFLPPRRPINLWTMSQRAGSLSYLTFGAGFSLAVYAFFVRICDLGRVQIGIFRTLGSNALAGYILHDLVEQCVKPYAPNDAPLAYALAAFGVFLAITYLFVRHLEKNQLFLRL